MSNHVQVKAEIPRNLKRQVFAKLALRDEKFNRWLRTQMELWLADDDSEERNRTDEQLAGSAARG